MHMIETHELRRTFAVRGKGEDVEAVRGVDLRVGEGEIFGFLGPNGAGKTTTLRTILGLTPARRGSVVFDGRKEKGADFLRLGIHGLPPDGPYAKQCEKQASTVSPPPKKFHDW